MSPVSRLLCATAALVLVSTVTPAHAAAPLVTLRVTSLNAALSDVETVSKSTGQPKTRKELLAQIAASLGVPDLAFLDLDRPLAVAFPFEGFALGAKGFVVVVPVKDAAAALKALGKSFPTHTKEGAIDLFRGAPKPQPDGTAAAETYAVAVRKQVLVMGQSIDLVKSFDEASALSGAGLPKGSVALAVQIEPIAPMLKMGLLVAKQKLTETQPAADADASGGAGADGSAEAEDDGSGEGDDDGTAEEAEPAPEKPAPEKPAPENSAPEKSTPEKPAPEKPALKFDAEAMRPFLDMYLNVISDALDNMSAFQLAFEVKDRRLVIHERVLPKAQSTLAEFVAAQREAGVPAIGSLVPGDAAFVAAGRVAATPASRAYMNALAGGWVTVMKSLFARQFSANQQALDEMFAGMADVERLLACQRGDLAFALDFGPAGMRMLEVLGVTPDEGCAHVLESLKFATVGEHEYTKVERSVLDPEGITTFVSTTRVPKELDPTGEVTRLYGKDGLVVRSAMAKDLMIFGTDPWSSKVIRAVAAAGPGGPAAGGGIARAELEPFTEGPGVFGRVDLGAFMAAVDGLTNQAQGERLKPELLQALKGPAGRVPFALRFLDGAASVEFALPLSLFEAFSKHGPSLKPQETVPPGQKNAPGKSTRRNPTGAAARVVPESVMPAIVAPSPAS